MISSEESYLKRLQRGSYEAFDYFYLSYSPMVERFLRAATKDRQAADDLSQDIFLKIWTNRAGLGRIRSFKAYLFTMCRNAVYDWLSTHKRAVSLPFGDEILEGLLIGNLQEEMEKEDLLMLLDLAVSTLPEQREAVFRLSRFQGMKNKEVARELGISEKTVEYHLSKAVAELRSMLGKI